MISNVNELLALDDEQFVENAFLHILGRKPDPNGLRFYVNRIRSGGGKKNVIVDMASSQEGLDFNSDFPGLTQLVKKHRFLKLISFGFFGRNNENRKIKLEHIQERLGYLDSELEYIRKNSNSNLKAGDTLEVKNFNFQATESENIKQQQYIDHKVSQSTYLKSYFASGAVSKQLDELFNIISKKNNRKVLIYPVSYPLELRQRPDHLMRYFAQQGYLCIAIIIDGSTPFVRERDGVYYTNLFAQVLAYFKDAETLLYITYPFFAYLTGFLSKSVVLYDLLDDLSIFSNMCDEMISDHNRLLSQANVVTYSSKILHDKNSEKIKCPSFLVPNGVWIEDFSSVPKIREMDNFRSGVTIGYYGAISELLDWELLHKLTLMKGIKLIMIGPFGSFNGFSSEQLRLKELVFSSPNVEHIPLVDYAELPNFLAKFDIGLVPFVVNEKTNPVSPLKMYEYMAASLPVFATNTQTLLGYESIINVAESAKLVDKIRDFCEAKLQKKYDYSSVLAQFSWEAKLSGVYEYFDNLFKKPFVIKGRKIDIVNINFFDWDGNVVYKGGAERYVYDLAIMLQGEGAFVRILQNANQYFERDFQGVKVVGVKTNAGHDLAKMSDYYRGFCRDSDLIIASPLELACRLYGKNVVSINHGIYWDHKFRTLKAFNVDEHKNTFDAIWNSHSVVCVDTNFINWIRTFDYASARSLIFVPNYYDSSKFKFSKKNISRIKVIYPRRLYEARGIFITLDAFRYVFKKHSNVDLCLVGQANDDDTVVINKFIDEYKNRVTWDEFDMDDMALAYQDTHIALVPTMYSEGTSLSCLEAMATNHAIIATNVGGLPNLVIDGYNGYLIDPSVESLISSLEMLIENKNLIIEMARNGGNLVKGFEKKIWLKKWDKVINEVLQ